jgi:hypothetical protein
MRTGVPDAKMRMHTTVWKRSAQCGRDRRRQVDSHYNRISFVRRKSADILGPLDRPPGPLGRFTLRTLPLQITKHR